MITVATISHRNAPIEVREELTRDAADAASLLRAAQRSFGSAAVLSTCHRLELYLGGEHAPQAVHDFLARALDADAGSVARHVRVLHGPEGVTHLCRVACGLESIVLGESEILGQVGETFSAMADAGTDDAALSYAFHAAIRVGRQARAQTAINRAASSVSSVAAQRASELYADFSTARVLIVGAGEAARAAARAMRDRGTQRVTVANRSLEHAEQLAAEFAGRATALDALPAELQRHDIVIAAAGSPRPLIRREHVEAAVATRDGVPLLMLDIGFPRDIDPVARSIRGAIYLDIEDLQQTAEANNAQRRGEVSAVESLIASELARVAQWDEQRAVTPTISAIMANANEVRRREVERLTPQLQLDAAQQERLEAFSEALMKRLLHDPIMALREHGDREGFLDQARRMFRLDGPDAAGDQD